MCKVETRGASRSSKGMLTSFFATKPVTGKGDSRVCEIMCAPGQTVSGRRRAKPGALTHELYGLEAFRRVL